MKRKPAVMLIGALCVCLVLSVVSVTAQQPPKPADPEEALYRKIGEQTREKPPAAATPEQQVEAVKAHILQIRGLCDEYAEKFPKGKHLPDVKVLRAQMLLFAASRFPQQPNEMTDAVKHVESVLAEYPKDEKAMLLQWFLVNVYMSEGKSDQALKHARDLLAKHPDPAVKPGILMGIYRIESLRGNTAEAVKALKTIIEKYPQSRAAEPAKASLKLAEMVGKPLQLKFTDVSGKEIDLAAYRGKVVLVDFWATWCQPCVQEMPGLVKLYGDKKGEGFEIIGISFDADKQKMLDYTTKAGVTWVQYFDGKGWNNELGKTFGIRSIPATFLVDREGVLRFANLRGEQLARSVVELLKEPKNRNE